MDTARWTPAMGLAVLVLFALLIPAAAEAQTLGERTRVGVKAALNLNYVRDEILEENERSGFGTAAGLSIGGLLTFHTHPNVTIQTEFIYSVKNLELLDAGDDAADDNIELRYFEIPVVAKLHGAGGETAMPFVLVGGTISFLTGAEQKSTLGGVTVTEDIGDEITSTEIGLTFGGGVDLLQDWGIITIDARYTLALGDLPRAGNIKLDTFSIGGGVIF
jgi:hypothetical protein